MNKKGPKGSANEDLVTMTGIQWFGDQLGKDFPVKSDRFGYKGDTNHASDSNNMKLRTNCHEFSPPVAGIGHQHF